MGFIIEILADLLLAFGVILIQWCIRNKKATLTILTIALMIADVAVLWYIVQSR